MKQIADFSITHKKNLRPILASEVPNESSPQGRFNL